jgi:dienelactone hydrolase
MIYFKKSQEIMKLTLLLLLFLSFPVFGQPQVPFVYTPLTGSEDFSSMMVDGMNRYLDRETAGMVKKRAEFWHADLSSPEAYSKSVDPNRGHLARIIGAVDQRMTQIDMEYVTTTSLPSKVAENRYFSAYAVRWNVFGNIHGEGLLLQPEGTVKARVVAIPDADQVPEMLIGSLTGLSPETQYARRLAENGCQVIIPTLINRSGTWSGSTRLNRFTRQPHREWIYRQAYTFGRHVIGYEVQKILAAIDWFERQNEEDSLPIGVVGWGEGGLLGFYSAALDTRINAALISGYFSNRDSLWREPIYRNLSGLLREFGDAEITGMIIPRDLIIEYSNHPEITGPPSTTAATPGRITTPLFEEVNGEVERAIELAGPFKSSLRFIHDNQKTTKLVCDVSLLTFLQRLDPEIKKLNRFNQIPGELRKNFDPDKRQLRQILEMENYTQKVIETSRHDRDEFFWKKIKPSTTEMWQKEKSKYQEYFWNNIIGRIPESHIDLNPKARQIFDKPQWTGYEITLDVLPDVFTWGYLLLPKDIKPGERRPVIVVQHGLGGVPSVVMEEKTAYNALAVKLVERGYVVYAPHFPWRAGHRYRNIQRKANPLGLTVFSMILIQHERILDWLTGQPWVDPGKIGLYGLSWGGKVAVRVPALLNRYSLAICSGDFNEWIWKNATTDWSGSYMYSGEYEMFDFNLGMTFNHAEMAALIAPGAFMVERGHDDGVGIDEWVAFEYSKVRRLYDKLNIPQMTEIEFFNGGHEIHAIGTFKFLERHFGLPQRNPD